MTKKYSKTQKNKETLSFSSIHHMSGCHQWGKGGRWQKFPKFYATQGVERVERELMVFECRRNRIRQKGGREAGRDWKRVLSSEITYRGNSMTFLTINVVSLLLNTGLGNWMVLISKNDSILTERLHFRRNSSSRESRVVQAKNYPVSFLWWWTLHKEEAFIVKWFICQQSMIT